MRGIAHINIIDIDISLFCRGRDLDAEAYALSDELMQSEILM